MNTLSRDVEINGSISFSQKLAIEGKVVGDVVSAGELLIGENAVIQGNVLIGQVVVHGTVNGNITAEQRCVAASSANITGDIVTPSLGIEAGAGFNGHASAGKAPAPAAPAAKTAPPAAAAGAARPATPPQQIPSGGGSGQGQPQARPQGQGNGGGGGGNQGGGQQRPASGPLGNQGGGGGQQRPASGPLSNQGRR